MRSFLWIFALAGPLRCQDIGDFDGNRCRTCEGLSACKILNGRQVPDVIFGYSRDESLHKAKQGVCQDFEKKTKSVELFGDMYQFRDNPVCRGLVNDYNCLSWAARDNNCDTPPRPPCRSLCVEIADKCVAMHLYRNYINDVCGHVNCSRKVIGNCVASDTENVKNNDRCSLHEYLPLPDTLSKATLNVPHVLAWILIFAVLCSVL